MLARITLRLRSSAKYKRETERLENERVPNAYGTDETFLLLVARRNSSGCFFSSPHRYQFLSLLLKEGNWATFLFSFLFFFNHLNILNFIEWLVQSKNGRLCFFGGEKQWGENGDFR